MDGPFGRQEPGWKRKSIREETLPRALPSTDPAGPEADSERAEPAGSRRRLPQRGGAASSWPPARRSRHAGDSIRRPSCILAERLLKSCRNASGAELALYRFANRLTAGAPAEAASGPSPPRRRPLSGGANPLKIESSACFFTESGLYYSNCMERSLRHRLDFVEFGRYQHPGSVPGADTGIPRVERPSARRTGVRLSSVKPT